MAKATTKKGKSPEQKQREVAELRDRLAAYTEELTDEEITVLSALHDGYSERNSLLLAMQAAERGLVVTDVDGYRAWQGRGRQVRKGETGLRILAPAGNGMTKAEQQAAEAEETRLQAAGEPAGEQPKRRQYFRLVSVFDVSQTDPIEQPQGEVA
jgi:antirestriction protein ArdC